VRLAVPLSGEIERGLQKVAVECVNHCPTGALVFGGKAVHKTNVLPKAS
jgi:hypothetical protein